MSKTLLCSLIASLFAAPALAQSDSDPMRVEGGGTAGGIYNNTSAFDKAQLNLYQDLGNGALTNIWARGRNYKASFDASGATFVPFFGARAPTNYPVEFTTNSVIVGETQLEVGTASPVTSVNSSTATWCCQSQLRTRWPCTA